MAFLNFTHAGYCVKNLKSIVKNPYAEHIPKITDVLINNKEMRYRGIVEIPGEDDVYMEWDEEGIPPNMARIDCYLKPV